MNVTGSACDTCSNGYPGEHTDACPKYTGAKAQWSAWVICECCQASGKTGRVYLRPQSNGLPATILKPTDGPCHVCGDNSPPGTFKNPWDSLVVRITFRGEPAQGMQSMLHVGKHVKRKARRVAA